MFPKHIHSQTKRTYTQSYLPEKPVCGSIDFNEKTNKTIIFYGNTRTGKPATFNYANFISQTGLGSSGQQ